MIIRALIAVVVLLLSYAGFVVANAPAGWVIAQAKPRLAKADIRLVNARGSAWAGSAGLILRGERLGRLSWSASPWPLLSGALAAEFSIQGKRLTLSGKLATAGETTRLTDIHARASIDFLARMLGLPADLRGTLVADLDKLVLGASRRIRSVEGKLVAHGVRIPDLGVALGNLTLSLRDSGKTILGRLENSGGDIDIRGRLTLMQSGSYVLQATLKPRPGPKQNQIRDALTVLLGATDSAGRFHYNATGRISLQ